VRTTYVLVDRARGYMTTIGTSDPGFLAAVEAMAHSRGFELFDCSPRSVASLEAERVKVAEDHSVTYLSAFLRQAFSDHYCTGPPEV